MSAAGSVEVDDMQPPGAGVSPPPGQGDRIVAEAGDPVEVPLPEPHRPAVKQVEGGEDQHRIVLAC